MYNLTVIHRATKKFALKPPSAATMYELAKKYRTAHAKWGKIYDQVETVRGLDEFDPKHMAWERRLYNAECKRDTAQQILLAAARCIVMK